MSTPPSTPPSLLMHQQAKQLDNNQVAMDQQGKGSGNIVEGCGSGWVEQFGSRGGGGTSINTANCCLATEFHKQGWCCHRPGGW